MGEAEKVKLYQQMLHKYLVYDKKETTTPPLEEQHKPNQPLWMEETIVKYAAIDAKESKAPSRSYKKADNVDWNSKGILVVDKQTPPV